MKNYTKAELEKFKQKKDAGEELTPAQLEAVKKFEGGADESVSIGGAGADGSGAVGGDEGKEGGGKTEGGGEEGGNKSQPGESPSSEREEGGAEVGKVDHLVSDLLTEKPESNDAVVQAMKDKIAKEKKLKGEQKKTRKVKQVGNVALTDKEEDFRLQCRKAGEMAWDTLVISGFTFMGPEWNHLPVMKDEKGAVTYDERTVGRQAYADMFEAYGWGYVPPWIGALTVTGNYVAMRVSMPATKEKVTSIKAKLFLWWKERKEKKKKKEAEIEAGKS